ncbi:hypothetical protein WJX72_006053 [[Myrmecia] bisecta]|uniref:non-specific serine/threonine protein kinase n=1 Tax=[Myrmecia] bisecta TaxID=41462 RepID=A0AAW1Q1J4_9CHLO
MQVLSSFTACLSGWGIIDTLRLCLPSAALETVELNGRQFRIVRLLAEGGYSFVYLAQEVPHQERPYSGRREFALKKVLAATGDAHQQAQHEIAIMEKLHHCNLLPLLVSARVPVDGIRGTAFYMLFPLYQDGSLAEELERRSRANSWLPAAEVLHIFLQVCCGVSAMHSMRPALAHRDIKPHNVLLQRRRPLIDGSCGTLELQRRASDAELDAQPLQEATACEHEGGEFAAVLMDFGSTLPAIVHVNSRQEALALQEEAEAHCTAPYKAPELFDVASHCTLDERVDVWSLGCLLYFMMYAISPFERVLNEAGGSLALAVINGNVTWPKNDSYPEQLRKLVLFCLNTNPSERPHVASVMHKAQSLLRQLEPLSS